MPLPEDFIFSQSALQDYVDCPRRFELRYLLEVEWPALETKPALEREAAVLKGQDFHHLLHQHALGVPAETLAATIMDKEVRGWWENYLGWQSAHLPAERHPEMMLTIPLADQLLMAKYDIVARMPDSTFLIIDWKTGRPVSRARLAGRMQTLVYPYVLARAGDWLNGGDPIPAEKIRMIYWFAETGETVEFPLTSESVEASGTKLESMIREIAERFEFPKTEDEWRCKFCAYRSLCERGIEAGDPGELDEIDTQGEVTIDLDQIEEISF
ncbi:MAG: PD-(D/E)XK nuclease family protein [Acidobacteriota bacterium]|nr:MAG: PD-(D/E)XK nuclease family protein [Acidobacteriota bacterium]